MRKRQNDLLLLYDIYCFIVWQLRFYKLKIQEYCFTLDNLRHIKFIKCIDEIDFWNPFMYVIRHDVAPCQKTVS